MGDHFVHGMPSVGPFEQRQTDRVSAELGFYQRIHGRGAFIFREEGGAYVAMAIVPMVKPPKLTIGFDRPDLRLELIPYDLGKDPPHKVRFWICDKGGRNRIEDLRRHIRSVELDARL
jgi:hypothetical protein